MGTLYTRFTYWTWGVPFRAAIFQRPSIAASATSRARDNVMVSPQARAMLCVSLDFGDHTWRRLGKIRWEIPHGNHDQKQGMSTDGEPLPAIARWDSRKFQLKHLSHLKPTENSRSWSVMPFTWYAQFLQLLVLGSAESCFGTWSAKYGGFLSHRGYSQIIQSSEMIMTWYWNRLGEPRFKKPPFIMRDVVVVDWTL